MYIVLEYLPAKIVAANATVAVAELPIQLSLCLLNVCKSHSPLSILSGNVSPGAEGVWAAQHRWCAPPQGDPEPRPHSAGPSRPRSADPLRRRLDVPVDAGMAALGFLSDDAQPAGLSPAATIDRGVNV